MEVGGEGLKRELLGLWAALLPGDGGQRRVQPLAGEGDLVSLGSCLSSADLGAVPCAAEGCRAEGVALAVCWDLLPGTIRAVLGSRGRELKLDWSTGDWECFSRTGHGSEDLYWS